jgi:hypothetical protein
MRAKLTFVLEGRSDAWLKLMGLMLLLTLNFNERNLLAQNRPVRFEHISLEQGLSQNAVNCILQDHKGFMWFGKQTRVNKDGLDFL